MESYFGKRYPYAASKAIQEWLGTKLAINKGNYFIIIFFLLIVVGNFKSDC
jgi:hypothetical protein